MVQVLQTPARNSTPNSHLGRTRTRAQDHSEADYDATPAIEALGAIGPAARSSLDALRELRKESPYVAPAIEIRNPEYGTRINSSIGDAGSPQGRRVYPGSAFLTRLTSGCASARHRLTDPIGGGSGSCETRSAAGGGGRASETHLPVADRIGSPLFSSSSPFGRSRLPRAARGEDRARTASGGATGLRRPEIDA